MSAIDRTEKVLRNLRILLAEGVMYDEDMNLIIVDKTRALEQLNELNECIDMVMDEYEQSKRSRDIAERKARQKQELAAKDAETMAQDVYAASILYTEDGLKRMQYMMQETSDAVQQIYKELQEKMQLEKDKIKDNQAELNRLMLDMRDSKKYQHIIEEQNRLIEKEMRSKEEEEEEAAQLLAVKAPKPQIRINEEYFREHGLTIEGEKEEKKETEEVQVNVNLDSEYFKWKEDSDSEEIDTEADKKEEKHVLFGKKKKNGK